MEKLKPLVNKSRSPFTSLERKLLSHLQAGLKPAASELLGRQVERINLVQRHADAREVCCYAMQSGKPVFDEEIQYPLKAPEVKFARVKFATPDGGKTWTANFFLVDGYFFSLVFDRSPKYLRDADEIQILETAILRDPMRAAPTVELEAARPEDLELKGRLLAWAQKFEPQDIYRPLSEDERETLLRDISATLPTDYMDIVRQCEGFRIKDCSLLGLSQVYEVALPDASYYVIAELGSHGLLAVRSHAGGGPLYYLSYSGEDPSEMRESLAKIVEAYLGGKLDLPD